MPEAIGPFVKVGHGQIGQDRGRAVWASQPDRTMREQSLVAPRVSFSQLVRAHVSRPEYDASCVVERPVLVKQAALALELPEERGSRIGCQDMERCTLQPVPLDPLDRPVEHIRVVVVESQDETPVDLASEIVQQRYTPGTETRTHLVSQFVSFWGPKQGRI